jgi:hypothetical protein
MSSGGKRVERPDDWLIRRNPAIMGTAVQCAAGGYFLFGHNYSAVRARRARRPEREMPYILNVKKVMRGGR